VVPLTARGQVLGAITLAFGESRRQYGEADLEMAEELARRASFAVEAARLYRESRQAIRARERLLAVVSHDLRNSLATVLLNSSAVLESPAAGGVDPGILDQLEWIARSAEQMNRLISDLLDVSAIELGRLSIEPGPQKVAELIGDAAELYRPLAAERGIGVTWEVNGELPDVHADAERMHQVLGNLLSNAIKFSPPESWIRIQASAADAGGVCFSVSDSGAGIEAEQLPFIFDPYGQGRRLRRAGAGLGLSIARAIVEAHNGTIWVESAAGSGSTFYFVLPTSSSVEAADG
jgi:signal transduction histidine kinase